MTTFFTGLSVQQLLTHVITFFVSFENWPDINHLYTNASKIKVVLFRSRNKAVNNISQLVLKNANIELVGKVKSLRVYFDGNLTLDFHENNASSKLNELNGISNKH